MVITQLSPLTAFFGPTYTTDSGSGPVTEYSGSPAAPPANGIPG